MTIKDVRGLQQTREQIARLRRSLESLKHLHGDTRQFELMAAVPRSMIIELEAEVDAYLNRDRGAEDA